jgi:hypothetical protein
MKIPGMSWFVEKLLNRIRALLWGMVASDVETESVLHHAENLSRLEDYARRLEADGKTQQAEAIRQRAAQISAHSPAGSALEAMADVNEDQQRALPDATQGTEPKAALPAPVRSRSRSRRPSRRRKSASTETDTNDSPTLPGTEQ